MAVPHGHNTLANELIWENSMETEVGDSHKQWKFFYDFVVFENSIIAERYKKMGLVQEEQIKIIGSSRFSDEWVSVLDFILPLGPLPKSSNNILKIVFMLTKPKYNGHPLEVERTIEYLSKFPNVKIIVKPHTRGMKFNKKFSSNVNIVDNEFHSPLLIDWADVLFTMTSNF